MAKQPVRTLSAEQEAAAAIIEQRLKAKGDETFREIARLLASKSDGELFGDTEFELRELVHELGAKALQAATDERKKRGCRGASIAVLGQPFDYKFQGYRSLRVVTLFGPIRVNRAYYHPSRAQSGKTGKRQQGERADLAPWDAELGIGPHRVSAAVERLSCTFGVDLAFATATERLAEASGVRLSESTIERITEDCGATLASAEAAGRTFSDDRPWEWPTDAAGQRFGCVALDATSVRQQGPRGHATPAKMAYVLRIFSCPSKVDKRRKRREKCRSQFAARLGDLDGVCEIGQKIGARIDAEHAQRWIGISDGGAGLEERLRLMFGAQSTTCILDFWHAKEYLAEYAAVAYPDDVERSVWKDAITHRLKHEGGQA